MNLEKLFMFGMRKQELPPVEGAHILLFKNNMPNVETTRQLTGDINQRAKRLIAVDCEGGSTVNVPGFQPVNAPRDQYHPDDVAFRIGKHLKYLGINTNLAPVCDLNKTERSLGEDPWNVGRKINNVVLSMRAANIVSCAKHFPGLPSEGDSHHGRVEILFPQLVPFFEAIKAGVSMVMMGHAVCTDIDYDLPASKSIPNYNLLRFSLGYKGVVITDSLEMKGCGDNLCDSVLDAFVAGADILTISSAASDEEQYNAFDEFRQAVERSTFLANSAKASLERVDKLLSRI